MAVWKFLQQFCVPRSSCRVLSSDLSRLAIRRSLTPELEGCPPRLVLYRTLSQAPAGPAAVDLGPSLSPAVRYLIGTHSITDLSAIQASGPKNRLLKGDILKYLENIKTGVIATPPSKPTTSTPSTASKPKKTTITPPSPPPTPSFTDIPLSEERRAWAAQCVSSKQSTPHSYYTQECELPYELLRAKKSTIRAHLIKSIALAVQSSPGANSYWTNDSTQARTDISISYHTLQDGVMTHTVIPAAYRVSLSEIADTLEGSSGRGDADLQTSSSISVYQASHSPVRESTGVLLPGQNISLFMSSPWRHRGNGLVVTVTMTTDSRVMGDELATQWLKLLQTLVSNSPILQL